MFTIVLFVLFKTKLCVKKSTGIVKNSNKIYFITYAYYLKP